MANCIECQIKDLALNKKFIYVAGLIIAKGEKRSFNARSNSPINAVITITIRDTKEHFCNATIWGSEQFIDNCVQAYKLGDIIVINKPTVVQKSASDQYVPKTTSPFSLQFTEGKGFIYRESIQNYPAIRNVLHQTIKSTSSALYLKDLIALPKSQQSIVDLMVVVQHVDKIEFIQTKTGTKSKRRIYFMDNTWHSMPMDIWYGEIQQKADNWLALKTILHLVDVRFDYSNFDKMQMLTMNGQTIIVENPIQSSRGNSLMQYLNHLTSEKYDELKTIQLKVRSNDFNDVDAITEIMTAAKILKTIKDGASNDFAVKMYGVFTKLNIDPNYDRNPIIRCCKYCLRFLAKNEMCTNVHCIPKLDGCLDFVEQFNITFNLTDHTGTLANCRITDEYATKLFNCTASEFKNLPETDIADIKNKYFLDRFAVKMIVKPRGSGGYVVNAVDIDSEDPDTMVENMKIY